MSKLTSSMRGLLLAWLAFAGAAQAQTFGSGQANLTSPSTMSFNGIAISTLLPDARQYTGYTVYTSDQGMLYSNGTSWVTMASASNLEVNSGVASDNSSTIRLYGTQAATGVVAVGIRDTQIFHPNGPTNVDVIQVLPHLGASLNNINNYEAFFVASMAIDADYAGTDPAITQIEACNVWNDFRLGGTAAHTLHEFRCFQADPITNGLSSTDPGMHHNWQFYANGGVANAAASGTTIYNGNYVASVPAGGSTAVGGDTINCALCVFGNGGTNILGTTENYVVYSISTALSTFAGGIEATPIGQFTPAAANFSTAGATTLNATSTLQIGSALMASATAPTIVSGFGTGAVIAHNHGTQSFSINVGTGGVATSGVIGLPTSDNAWACSVSVMGAANTTDATTTSGTSASSITVKNYVRTTGIVGAWTASDVLQISCFPN